MNCLKYVRPGFNFEPEFPLANKGDVNGIYEQPIFAFLKVSTLYYDRIDGYLIFTFSNGYFHTSTDIFCRNFYYFYYL